MKRCEHCLRETPDRCPAHPHADLLDPTNPSDQEWLSVLAQRRSQRRWRVLFSLLGLATLGLSMLWMPLTVLWLPLVVVATMSRPTQPILLHAHTLLPSDNTKRAPRLQRPTRGRARRPEPSRVTMAG